ncbi:MAG: acetyltransferase [Lysobacteraceae bacterium]|nr:MAG: acetyltransferase [Xanthomonadaceae bacterium]
MSIALTKPSIEYKASYEAYIAELADEERYPFPLDYPHQDFPALLQRLEDLANGVNLPSGYVPSTTYWLIKDDDLIGVSNLRHFLNPALEQSGGHIGLGVRPSHRHAGIGKTLMALTIAEARKRGIGDIHIHCYKNNPASARLIVASGGKLHSEVGHAPSIVQRYVVPAASR